MDKLNEYQDTKLGKIPCDWRCVRQDAVSTFHNGRAYKLSEWEKEGTPVIRLQNLTGSGQDYYYSNLKLPERQYVNNGDLLFMWSATFGPKIWKGDKAIYHYHIWKVDCDESQLDKTFMFYNLDYMTEVMKSQTNGSTMLHLTKKGMEEQLMRLPPLSEQLKISEILVAIDNKGDLLTQKIEQTKELKKGLVQKLFSVGMGELDANGNWHPHVNFCEKTGYPKNWKKLQFIEAIELKRGYDLPTKDRCPGSYNIYGSNGIVGSHTKSMVKGPGIITGRSGTIGKVIFSEREFWPLNTSLYVRNFNGNDPKFCFYFLEQFGLKKYGTGTGVPTLNRNVVHKEKIVIPSDLKEQKAIADILETVDSKITILIQQRNETARLKKGLMQKLLNGKWRTNCDKAAVEAKQ